MFQKIPIIKTVYSTSRQIIEVIHSDNGESVYKSCSNRISQKWYTVIGFITADKNIILKDFLADKEIVNVFVPTSPNPTSGFLLFLYLLFPLHYQFLSIILSTHTFEWIKYC